MTKSTLNARRADQLAATLTAVCDRIYASRAVQQVAVARPTPDSAERVFSNTMLSLCVFKMVVKVKSPDTGYLSLSLWFLNVESVKMPANTHFLKNRFKDVGTAVVPAFLRHNCRSYGCQFWLWRLAPNMAGCCQTVQPV